MKNLPPREGLDDLKSFERFIWVYLATMAGLDSLVLVTNALQLIGFQGAIFQKYFLLSIYWGTFTLLAADPP